MKLPVLSVADGAAWEERLVAALAGSPLGVEIARRCVDVTDLLAVAASGQGRAALLTATLRHLDADAVDRLALAGVVPVAVVPRGDAVTEERMHALGIEHTVPEDADAGIIAGVVAQAVRSAAEPAPVTAQRAFADPSVSMPVASASAPLPPGAGAPPPADDARRGTVIAVWGPTGAPGRTTVAVTLADEVARLGRSALLVDADVYGGTIAAVLGLLDESPGLAAACREAATRRLDATALAALCWQLGPRLRVLTGIPLPARWPELRPSGISAVLAAARTLADVTVVDCGFCLETDEELSFDTTAPRRNGATLAVLDDADTVLAVGAADPIGMQRLVRGLAELRDAEVGADIRVVLNRVRGEVVPGDPAAELRAALERFAGHTPAALLPADLPGLDAALATGRLLSEASPGSPLRRAVAELAASLTDLPLPGAGRRRRRR
jgi:MinD-like ATPase involved in chromosome partitioning or flagellar assembly